MNELKVWQVLFLPLHDVPEPLKPDLQVHVKPPFVLVQSALE